MIDEATLSGLDMDSAKELIFAYTVDAKRIEREMAQAQAELDKWKGRLALVEGKMAAGESSVAPLAEGAKAKMAELASALETLASERAGMLADVGRIREKLPYIKSRERSIDPDRLLAELQMMTGELLGQTSGAGGYGPKEASPAEPGAEGRSPAATEADFAKLERESRADSELEELKRKARGDQGGGA